jgi:aminoglycoside 6'-N-acetyltransferase
VAIRCYRSVGFKVVGVRRQAERDSDGTWHDALLMDLLADDLADPDGLVDPDAQSAEEG